MNFTPVHRIQETGKAAMSSVPAIAEMCVGFGRRHPATTAAALVAGVTALVWGLCYNRR